MKYLDKSDLITKSNKIKKIFFYRICGTGMGAAAILLKEAGFEVEGGDINFRPPMSDYLESTKIPLHNLKDIDLDYLKTFDLIVVGNVVSKKGQGYENFLFDRFITNVLQFVFWIQTSI